MKEQPEGKMGVQDAVSVKNKAKANKAALDAQGELVCI